MADLPLPQAALSALQRGDKLAAIRLVREATGLDLKRAALAVEAHVRARGGQAHAATDERMAVAQQALDALISGKKLEAFKILREAGGKDLGPVLGKLEQAMGGRNDAAARNERRNEHRLDAQRAQDGAKLQALIHQKRVPTVAPGDAPGGGLAWVLVALGAALLWVMMSLLGG